MRTTTPSSAASMMSSVMGIFVQRSPVKVLAKLCQGRTKYRSRQTGEIYHRYNVIIVLEVENRSDKPVFIRRVLAAKNKKQAELTRFEDQGLRIDPRQPPVSIQVEGEVLARQINRLMLEDDQGRLWDVPAGGVREMVRHYPDTLAEVEQHNAADSWKSAAGIQLAADDDDVL